MEPGPRRACRRSARVVSVALVVGQERRTLGVSVLVGLLWVIPHVASACSCMEPRPPTESLASAAAVFEGRAVARRGPDDAGGVDPIVYEFEVARRWKGEVGERVTIHTAASSAACGRRYEIDEAYLLYAYEAGGVLRDSICSRTRRIIEADADLEALGPGQPPVGDSPEQTPSEARDPPRIEPSPAPPATAEPRGCRIAGDPSTPALALALGLVALLIGRPRRLRR